jgi:hypothetical protein
MELAVTSLGMVSAVGLGVVPGCAAIRAGIVRPQPLWSFEVLESEPVEAQPLVAHPIEGYTEGFLAVGRWLRLAAGAFDDLIAYGTLPDRNSKTFWRQTGLIAALPFPEEESLSGNTQRDLELLRKAFVLRLPKHGGPDANNHKQYNRLAEEEVNTVMDVFRKNLSDLPDKEHLTEKDQRLQKARLEALSGKLYKGLTKHSLRGAPSSAQPYTGGRSVEGQVPDLKAALQSGK